MTIATAVKMMAIRPDAAMTRATHATVPVTTVATKACTMTIFGVEIVADTARATALATPTPTAAIPRTMTSTSRRPRMIVVTPGARLAAVSTTPEDLIL